MFARVCCLGVCVFARLGASCVCDCSFVSWLIVLVGWLVGWLVAVTEWLFGCCLCACLVVRCSVVFGWLFECVHWLVCPSFRFVASAGLIACLFELLCVLVVLCMCVFLLVGW